MQINSIPAFKGWITGKDCYRNFAIKTDKITHMEGYFNDDARIYYDEEGVLRQKPLRFYHTIIYFNGKTKTGTEIDIPYNIKDVIQAYNKAVKDETAVVEIKKR